MDEVQEYAFRLEWEQSEISDRAAELGFWVVESFGDSSPWGARFALVDENGKGEETFCTRDELLEWLAEAEFKQVVNPEFESL